MSSFEMTGTLKFSVAASYKGSSEKKYSNKVSVTLTERPLSEGVVYNHLNMFSLPAADTYSVDIPPVVAANELFHITINPQKNIKDYTISLYDPTIGNQTCVYPYERFLDAWDDSKNYMITVE